MTNQVNFHADGAGGRRSRGRSFRELLDLFASYKVNGQFQIDAAIDNLTDEYSMDTLTPSLMPSRGRTLRMNMTAKFRSSLGLDFFAPEGCEKRGAKRLTGRA